MLSINKHAQLNKRFEFLDKSNNYALNLKSKCDKVYNQGLLLSMSLQYSVSNYEQEAHIIKKGRQQTNIVSPNNVP